MISVIRERLIRNKAYKYIVWGLVITMSIFWTIPGLLRVSGGGTWIAVANGQEVDYSDFLRMTHEREFQLQMFRQQYGQYTDMVLQAMGLSADPRLLALEDLIRNELLNGAAQELRIQLSEEYILEKLSDVTFIQQALSDIIPPELVDPAHGISQQRLKAYLRSTKLSMNVFEDKIKKALLRYQLLELALLGSYVPTFELKDQYTQTYLGKRFTVIEFSLAEYLQQEKSKKLSVEQIKAFFDKHNGERKRYWVPERRNGTTWTFNPDHYGVTVTDEEMEMYYQDHKLANFLEKPVQIEIRTIVFKVSDEQQEQAVYKKAKAIHELLVKSPELFANQAQEHSQEPLSGKRGGLLVPFAKGKQDPVIEEAAFALKKDGDIATILRTSKGFEIIQRVAKHKPVFKPFKAVTNEIKRQLLKKKFAEQFAQDMHNLIAQGQIQDQALKNFVQEHGGTVKTYPMIEKSESKVAQALFGLKEGDVSFYVEGDDGVAVQLNKIAKSYAPSFDSVREVVAGDLYEDLASNRLKKSLREAQEKAASLSMAELSEQFLGKIIKVGMIKKGDNDALAKAHSQGLPIDQMLLFEKVGLTHALEKDGNGYLVRLEEIEPFNDADFKEKKAELNQSLAQERTRAAVDGFVASLYRTATIKINESLLNGENHPNQVVQYYEE